MVEVEAAWMNYHFNYCSSISVASESNAMAKALKTCKAAFGDCRKAEDRVAGLIHGCKSDADAMKSKLLALTVNKASIQKAEANVNNLSGRQNSKQLPLPQRDSSKAITTCSGVLAVATAMISLVRQIPSSAEVGKLAEQIAASTGLTCSFPQQVGLRLSISIAIDELDTEMNTVQISLSRKFFPLTTIMRENKNGVWETWVYGFHIFSPAFPTAGMFQA